MAPVLKYLPTDYTFSGLLTIGQGLSFPCTVPGLTRFLLFADTSLPLVTALGMTILIDPARIRRTAPLNLPFLALIPALQIGLAVVKGAPDTYRKGAEGAGLTEGVLRSLRP